MEFVTNKHETKACPRCGADFECRTGSISRCQCQRVTLDHEQAAYIAARYEDCLCASCLAALRSQYNILMHRRRVAAALQDHATISGFTEETEA